MDGFDLSTVLNREDFVAAACLEQHPLVGRTLVAKQELDVGHAVLIEQPLLQYHLQPQCRSSLSPYFTKTAWNALCRIVRDENDGDASFLPGLPAAMLAYVSLDPPYATTNKKEQKKPSLASLAFFYYPALDMEHATVQLVLRVARRVTTEIDLFGHMDAHQLACFVLKIYGNAHTVLLDRKRNARVGLSTHSRKQHRRDTVYADRYHAPPWPCDPPGPRPSIALMAWGSKFAHSCAPNLVLHYDATTNAMTFTTTRTIHPGDVLTFSYLPENEDLGGLLCGTSIDRQAKLAKFKFFDCACERCIAIDAARLCACNEDDATTRYHGRDKIWRCDACESTAAPDFVGREKGEAYAGRMVTALAAKLKDPAQTGDVLSMLEPFLTEDLLPTLPLGHWTYAYSHALLAQYHLHLLPVAFGKGLASQLDATALGLHEARVFLCDFMHTRLWPTNPVPVFMGAWDVLRHVIHVVTEATEQKQYRVAPKKTSQNDYSEDDDDDGDAPPPEELPPLILPMPEQWKQDVLVIRDAVTAQWIPFVTSVFKQPPPAIADMIHQINQWSHRVDIAMDL
ncbi:hypothetical protein BC940DRAFT_310231 [Gongronella butleri]|nr:hypothetical protein BC940DRAFT_310231 [Gongronella butleri]